MTSLHYLWVYFCFLVLEHQVLFSGVLSNFLLKICMMITFRVDLSFFQQSMNGSLWSRAKSVLVCPYCWGIVLLGSQKLEVSNWARSSKFCLPGRGRLIRYFLCFLASSSFFLPGFSAFCPIVQFALRRILGTNAGFTYIFPLFQDFGCSSPGCFGCFHQRALFKELHLIFYLLLELIVLRRMIVLDHSQRKGSSGITLIFKKLKLGSWKVHVSNLFHKLLSSP